MTLIKTKSFELAVFTRGNESAQRIAILIPGRLDTKDYGNFVSHAEFLATRGFFVVAFDPAGTWESPGTIDLVTTTNYLKEVNELIEYFGNRPTLLMGHSRGSATAMLASAHPAVIAVVIALANFGSPTPLSQQDREQGFQLNYRDLPPGISKTEERKEFKLPIYYWEDGEKYNPLQVFQQCTKPKLLIYGTRDEFSSPDEAKAAYASLPEPKIIVEVDSTHDYRYSSEAIEQVNQAIGELIDTYL